MAVLKELWNRTAAGDGAAFEKIFKAYYPGLCGYANKVLHDPVQAEEIVQETFIRLWEKRNDLKVDRSFESYLFRSVYNNCISGIRETERRKAMEKEFNSMAGYNEDPSGESQFRQGIMEQKIMAAVRSLPDQCRQVFELSKIEKLRYRDIAERMNISVKTVENHMGRALKKLREELSGSAFMMMMFIFSRSEN